MNHTLTYDEILTKNFEKTLDSLKQMKTITGSEINDEKIKASLIEMNQNISKSVTNITKEISNLKENMSWDKVHIAFFGETSAGKSTIIEAITKGNGITIGDGTKDFTQKATPVVFKDKVLIDLPGMEGKENKYIDEIKKGINQSHYVFYVSDTNKEPDEGVLNKIRSYLKEQTNIYSIVNIRQPLSIKTKDNLINSSKKIVIERTDEKFKEIFGSHYKGIIPVQADLAFRLRTNSKDDNTRKKIEKAIDIFGDTKTAYYYSNLNRVVRAIMTTDLNEIAVANTYKFLNLSEEIIGDILRSKKVLDAQIDEIENEFEKAKSTIRKDVDNFQVKIQKIISVEILKFKNKVKEFIRIASEKNLTESEVKKEAKKFEAELNSSLKVILNAESKNLSKSIARSYKEMNNQIKLGIKFTNFGEGFIDVEDLIAKFSLNIKVLLKNIAEIALSAVMSFLINPIAGIITTSVSIISKILNWNIVDKHVEERKQIRQLQDKIDGKFRAVEMDINKKMLLKIKSMKNQIEVQNQKLELHIKNLNKVSLDLTYKIKNITKVKSEVSKNLMEYIEQEKIEFAYIDYNLKKMFYIGGKLKNKNIYNMRYTQSYNNLNEFFANYQSRIKGEFIYLKFYEEFQKRAISELINYIRSNYKSFNLKGVRRDSDVN